MTGKGKLFVISAPSGAGKTTLVRKVLGRFETLSYSVSHTTRNPRGSEQDGLDYFFISPEEFEQKIAQDHWLEWAKVHDNYYGTSKEFVRNCLEKGQSLILDIDVQGAKQMMVSDLKPVTIFILPPSFEILSQRLENRGTDSKQVIARRLENAKQEMDQKDKYQYVVVNDDLDQATEALCLIFKKEMG
ncbi:MAG: guanylate kinase [Proteobacteria bacterium]|nr:guanylate kinase [Pseudomonadota bacterium]MBU1582300.1 guanylate kinase [Pseudomonadota bacterium]MBU2452402.1 guanylate kinase [Pseudomonadota bacterium]MBU2627166.1 guanylate kinase [Pseudomonadota bacterium]